MQPNHIYSLVQDILKPKDNHSRLQAENTLIQMYRLAPQQTIDAYLDILEMQFHSQDQADNTTLSMANFHKFISVQLKICLSKNPRQPYQSLWAKISENAQQRTKQRLCNLMQLRQNSDVVKQTAEIIGNLASHIIAQNEQTWAQLSSFILTLASSEQPSGLYFALVILQSFYMNEVKNYKEIIVNLVELFEVGFQHANIEINYYTLRCVAAYLLVLDHQRHRQFTHMIPMMIKVVLDLLDDNDSKGLDVFVECWQYQPKFFKKQFHALLQLCENINNSDLDQKIKRIATTALLQLSNLCPSLFRNNPNAVNLIVDMIVMRMLVMPESITLAWMAPEEGFDFNATDQPEADIIYANLCQINKLIRVVGEDYVLPRIRSNIDKLFSIDKWTYLYVAVAILSQLGQYLTHIDDIKNYTAVIFELFRHENPKIRYIAVHAIGMLAQQRKKEVNSRYASLYIHNMCDILMRQACPRVVAHIWDALSNLLTGFPYNHLRPYFNQLIATAIDCLVNGISIVKEAALFTLSQIVGVSYESQQKKIITHLPFLFKTISQYFYNEEYLSPCYNNLRGISLQSMSLIALMLGREEFQPYLRPFVITLMRVDSEEYERLMPPFNYIVAAWTRLGYTFGADLEQYIHDALPKMLSIILDSVRKHSEQGIDDEQDEDQLNNKFKQHQMMNVSKEIDLGVKMLNALIAHVPSIATCYYEEICAIYVALINFSADEDLKKQVYKSLATFISELDDDVKKVQTGVHLIQLITSSVANESESTMLSCKFKTIACLLNLFNIKILHPQLLDKLADLVYRQLLKSNAQIFDIMRRSVDFDPDQLQEAECQIKIEEEIQEALSDVFTELMHLYGRELLDFAMLVMREFVVYIFQEGQRQNKIKIGLFFIDELVKYLDYQCLKPHWLWIKQNLQKYTQSNSCQVRQAACYGLGILAQRYPSELKTVQTANAWFELLHSAYQIARYPDESKIKYMHCSDNIVAAMGKVINSFRDIVIAEQHMQFWLGNLPLKRDLLQNIEMTNIIIELIENCTQIMCEYSKQRILQLLKLIAQGTQAMIKLQMVRLKKCLMLVLQSNLFVNNTQEIRGQLDQTTVSKLQELFNFESPSSH